MGRPFPWLWVLLALLLLLPGPAGRFLLDLLGGLTLALLLVPVLAGGAALIGWQILRRRLRTCPSCGVASLGQPVCPACGTLFDADVAAGTDSVDAAGGSGLGGIPWGWGRRESEIDPRDVTINVEAVDVRSVDGKPGDGDAHPSDPSRSG